jgi:hypothetical protein
MKVKKLKLLSIASLAVGLLSVQVVPANAVDVAPIKTTLAGVSGLELPGKTAGLVATAADQDKKAVTISAIEVAVGMNPSAAPAIVGAVSTQVPSMASVASATASKLQPQQAVTIVEAAAKAAPSQAAAIVAATSKEVPAQYARIAIAASKVAPSAKQDILVAASGASPAPMRAKLAKAATASSTASLPMEVTFARTYAHAVPMVGASSTSAKYYGTFSSFKPEDLDRIYAGSTVGTPSILDPISGKGRTVITDPGIVITTHPELYSSPR